MENKIRIRRVHLQSLMNTLAEVWDRGVEFVDLYGVMVDGQDTVGIAFSRPYMNEDYADNFDLITNEQLPSKVEVKLSDEDLNQLI